MTFDEFRSLVADAAGNGGGAADHAVDPLSCLSGALCQLTIDRFSFRGYLNLMATAKRKANDDPAMARVRTLWNAKQKEGWTQQQLGERMGYPIDSARKSVSQFLKSHDPKISTLRRFAKALGLSLVEIIKEGR